MIRPLSHRVVIRRDVAEPQRGIIVTPESSAKPKQSGTIVAVGPGKLGKDGKRHEIGVSVGQRITFADGGAFKWDSPEGELLIVHGDAITGVIG